MARHATPPSTSDKLYLLTVTGMDFPGITSQLTRLLAESGACLTDIAQNVLHDHLSLSLLFRIEHLSEAFQNEIRVLCDRFHLNSECRPFEAAQKARASSSEHRYALTVFGNPISGNALSSLTEKIASFGLNIDEIQKLSESSLDCLEMQLSSPTPVMRETLQTELLGLAQTEAIDFGFQAEGLFRRMKRLIVFDMDSTLIQNEVIDEFAKKRNVYDAVSAITRQAMGGGLPFRESLQRRVSFLKGLTLQEIDEVYASLTYTAGAERLIPILKRLGYKIAVISGGFDCITEKIRKHLDIDYAFSNTLEMGDGKATGRVLPPIVDAEKKAELLSTIAQTEKISLDQVIAVGDGANDIPMLARAGLGIAFHAKPLVREKAHLALNQGSLINLLYLLGFSEKDLKSI